MGDMMMQTNKFFKTKRKGITPIIAIVLLLMMTVAAFGLTFVWVQSTQQDLQESIGKDIQAVTDKNAAQFSIESIYNETTDGNISIVLRNTGRYVFGDASTFTIYLNGIKQDSDISGTFDPDTTKTATIITTGTDWSVLEIGTNSFKIVSSKGTQATATCSSSSAVNGYC